MVSRDVVHLPIGCLGKLLIEAAKKQLALQQQQQLTSTTVPPSQTQIATMDNIVETMPITTVSPDKLTIKQEAEDQDRLR